MGYALETLGATRCKEIASGLFKVDKEYGGVKLNGFCPIHQPTESNPSFVYHFEGDWYKCKSCGVGGDLVKLWEMVTGGDFLGFKKEYVTDSGSSGGTRPVRKLALVKPKVKIIVPDVFVSEDDLTALPPLPAARIAELKTLRGWSDQVIISQDLREFSDHRGGKRIAIPVRDDQERLCNIRLYQPGAAEFKVISWYDQLCKACGGKWKTVGKKKVCRACGLGPNDYGRTRLYPPPAQWKPGRLWLVEGEPDLLCALSNGINAVTQTAGCGTWRDEFSEAMAGRDVVICFDADEPGFKGAGAASKSLVEHAKSVRVIVWPELMGTKP